MGKPYKGLFVVSDKLLEPEGSKPQRRFSVERRPLAVVSVSRYHVTLVTLPEWGSSVGPETVEAVSHDEVGSASAITLHASRPIERGTKINMVWGEHPPRAGVVIGCSRARQGKVIQAAGDPFVIRVAF